MLVLHPHHVLPTVLQLRPPDSEAGEVAGLEVEVRVTDQLHPPPPVQLPARREEDAGAPLPGSEAGGRLAADLHLHLEVLSHPTSHLADINQPGGALHLQLEDLTLRRVLDPVNMVGSPTDVVPSVTVVHGLHLEVWLVADHLDPPGHGGVEPLDGGAGTAVSLAPQHGAAAQPHFRGHWRVHSD